MEEWTLWHCCISRKFSGYGRMTGVCGYGYGWQISYPRQACCLPITLCYCIQTYTVCSLEDSSFEIRKAFPEI